MSKTEQAANFWTPTMRMETIRKIFEDMDIPEKYLRAIEGSLVRRVLERHTRLVEIDADL